MKKALTVILIILMTAELSAAEFIDSLGRSAELPDEITTVSGRVIHKPKEW